MTPTLLITPGEPAGIGPDLVLRYLSEWSGASAHASTPIIIADLAMLQQRREQLQLDVQLTEFDPGAKPSVNHGAAYVIDTKLACPAVAGRLNPANARYVLQCLDTAIDLCRNRPNHALVTGPLHKGVINDAGIRFSGHTEYLAERCHVSKPVMMLATTGLRVALATTHLPLAQVSAQITQPLLEQTLSILHNELITKFHISEPQITVCGLNPHAGESGHLGREEIEIIEPVIERLNQQGMHLLGPLPADTAFTRKYMLQTDAYLAMYHDQGLPVLKHVGFGNAVNITLGLPFIRTSVDHGTALELAGSGLGDATSPRVAIEIAEQMLGADH